MRKINLLAFLTNTIKKIPIYLMISRFVITNKFSQAPIINKKGPTLSLTTHGFRLKNVYLAIESIARGSLKPSRLMLNLDVEKDVLNPPKTLKRLKNRGLEIILSENLGPHTKLQPWLINNTEFDKPHVVADDDIIYPRWWLKKLCDSHSKNPKVC